MPEVGASHARRRCTDGAGLLGYKAKLVTVNPSAFCCVVLRNRTLRAVLSCSLYCARTAPSCVQGAARGDLSHSQQLDMIVVDLRSLRRAKLRCCCTAQAISTSMPSRRAARAASHRQRLCLAIPSTANQVSCPCPRCAEVSVQVRAVSPARQTKNAKRRTKLSTKPSAPEATAVLHSQTSQTNRLVRCAASLLGFLSEAQTSRAP